MQTMPEYLQEATDAIKSAGLYYYYPLQPGQPATDSTSSNLYELAKLKYQNDYNAEQAELAFQRERDLINEQNEYNSPANQMARYMEAGLNPSVIYGQIGNGNQSNVAQYAPQRAADANFKETSRTEKFNRTMAIINTIFDAFGKSAQLAQQIEGVRNQSLQNEILTTQMPAVMMESSWRAQHASDLEYLSTPFWTHEDGSIEDKTKDPAYQQLLKIYYPNFYRSEYQDWWNTSIAPLYKNLESGKVDIQGLQKWMLEYQKSMMDSMPPGMKMWMPMLMPFLQAMMRL